MLPRHLLRSLVGIVFSLLAVSLLESRTWTVALVDDRYGVLTKHFEFDGNDLRDLDRGEVVRRTLRTARPTEVAVVGAGRVKVPWPHFIEKFRDIATFKRSPAVPQIGVFGTPPRLEDLDSLTLDADDVDALRRCRPADCDLHLSTEMVGRFQREVNWAATDAANQATTLMKRSLVDRVRGYRAEGNRALGEYNTDKRPVRLGEQFKEVLRASPYLLEAAPRFYEYLDDYPQRELPGVEDFVYWSKERLGPKTNVSLTHVAIHTRVDDAGTMTLIASRDLYSSRYVDASLGLTIVMGPADSSAPDILLVYVNRTRVDALDGAFSGLRRRIVERRVRSGMEESFRNLRTRLEKDYRAIR